MKNENIITLDELGEVALSKLIRSHPYDIDHAIERGFKIDADRWYEITVNGRVKEKRCCPGGAASICFLNNRELLKFSGEYYGISDIEEHLNQGKENELCYQRSMFDGIREKDAVHASLQATRLMGLAHRDYFTPNVNLTKIFSKWGREYPFKFKGELKERDIKKYKKEVLILADMIEEAGY